MATIAQKQLFGWEEIEDLGDLERLWLVLEYLSLKSVVVSVSGLHSDREQPGRPHHNTDPMAASIPLTVTGRRRRINGLV